MHSPHTQTPRLLHVLLFNTTNNKTFSHGLSFCLHYLAEKKILWHSNTVSLFFQIVFFEFSYFVFLFLINLEFGLKADTPAVPYLVQLPHCYSCCCDSMTNVCQQLPFQINVYFSYPTVFNSCVCVF